MNMASYQFRGFNAEFLGYIVNLGVCDGRTNSTAAIATIQTAEEFKSFSMKSVYGYVKHLLISLLKFLDYLDEGLLMKRHQGRKVSWCRYVFGFE